MHPTRTEATEAVPRTVRSLRKLAGRLLSGRSAKRFDADMRADRALLAEMLERQPTAFASDIDLQAALRPSTCAPLG